MTQRFKLVNKSRITNNRIRLIKTATATTEIDPLFGAIYSNDNEVGICLSPNTVISCMGAKVESDEIKIEGNGWSVEVDGVVLDAANSDYSAMVELLEANGIRVTELVGEYKQEIVCDGAVAKETLKMQDGGWLLEVDGESMGGPYDLATLDSYSRRREVRVIVPEPLTCNIGSRNTFTFIALDRSWLKDVRNALTGEVIFPGNWLMDNTNLENNDFIYAYDNNYGTGYITNRTEECVLLQFRSFPDAPPEVGPNSGLDYYSEDNATVFTDDDGVDFISLGPTVYDVPGFISYSAYLDEGNGNFRHLMNEPITDADIDRVYIGVRLPYGYNYRLTGYTVTYGEEVGQLFTSDDIEYFKVSRVAVNAGYTTHHYLFNGELVSPDGIELMPDRLYDSDLMVNTARFDGMVAPYQVEMEIGGITHTFVGNDNTEQLYIDPRVGVSRGATIKLTCPVEFIGGVVTTDLASESVGVIGLDGTITFQLPVEYTGPVTMPNIYLNDPAPLDERELAHLYTKTFCTLDGLILQ